MKVVALVSGGKDSCFSMHMCGVHGHQVVALANLLPPDSTTDELDSYMYQTVGHQLVAAYAACTGLPLYRRRIQGSSTSQGLSYSHTAGDEVEDLFLLLAYIKEQHPDIQAVASGAIASDYQRLRVESVCSRLGLVSLGYLWHQPQDQLLSDMIANNIEAILVKVAALGLDPYKHLGKSIRQMQPYLRSLRDRFGCNVCGEGGEYETLTLDCPAFQHGRIVLDDWQVILHSPDSIAPVGVLHPTAFHIEPKTLPDTAQQRPDAQQQQQQQEDEKEQQQQQPDHQSAVVVEVPANWQPQGALDSSSTQEVAAAVGRAAAAAAAWDTTVDITISTSQIHVICAAAAKDSADLPLAEAEAAMVGGLTAADTAAALEASLLAITAQLPSLGLAWSDSCFVHLHLADMAHFGTANDVYCKHLPQVEPPSRACVQVPLPPSCPVLIDILFARPVHLQPLPPAAPVFDLHDGQQQQQQEVSPPVQQQQQRPCERRVLHVQSISSWAPSCIGPYSQATSGNGLIHMAGQIPLDPASMVIIPAVPGDMAATIATQTWRALCSCQAVAVAVHSCFATAAVGLVVYLSESCAAAGGQGIVQAALEAVWADRSLLDSLKAPATVMQAAAAAAVGREADGAGADQSSSTAAGVEAVQSVQVGSSSSDCDESDDAGQECEQFIDGYLRAPAVACALKPAVVYVTVPALPRGSLLEVQPVLQDLAALQTPASSSSSSSDDEDELVELQNAAAALANAQDTHTTAEAPAAADESDAEAAGDCQIHVTSNTIGDGSTSWRRILVHLAEFVGSGSSSSRSCEQAIAAARLLIAAACPQHANNRTVSTLPQLHTLRCWHASPAGGQSKDHAWQHALVTTVQQALSSSQQQIAVQFVPVRHIASSGIHCPCWAVVEAYSTL